MPPRALARTGGEIVPRSAARSLKAGNNHDARAPHVHPLNMESAFRVNGLRLLRAR